MAGCTRLYLSMVLERRGDLDRSEAEARQAIVDLESYALTRPIAAAQLASVLLARGQPEHALPQATDAFEAVCRGPVDDGEMMIRVVYAEVLGKLGRNDEAANVLRGADLRLQEQAARIADESQRARFLRGVPEHARLLELVSALAS